MKRPILLTLLITGALCLIVLIWQKKQNNQLVEQLEKAESRHLQLEQDVRHARHMAGLSERYRSPADRTSAAIEKSRAESTPGERVKRALARINLLASGVDDVQRSPAAFFRILPDLLRVVQDLDLDEMIQVAEQLEPGGNSSNPSPRMVCRMVLFMLAAEQDPMRIIEKTEVMKDMEMRMAILGSLTRSDPEAAKRWLASSDIPPQEKTRFQSLIGSSLMKQDIEKGLRYQLELRKENKQSYRFYGSINMVMNEEHLPELAAALKKPEFAELKPDITGMILSTSMLNGGVEAARSAVDQYEIGSDELGTFLQGNIYSAIQSEPDAVVAWMRDALPEDQQLQIIPNAVSQWASADYNAAGNWLGNMEPSPLRDSSISRFASTVAQIDPESAAAWTKEIQDESRRSNAMISTHAVWSQKDKEKADAWLREQGLEPGQPVPHVHPGDGKVIIMEEHAVSP